MFESRTKKTPLQPLKSFAKSTQVIWLLFGSYPKPLKTARFSPCLVVFLEGYPFVSGYVLETKGKTHLEGFGGSKKKTSHPSKRVPKPSVPPNGP